MAGVASLGVPAAPCGAPQHTHAPAGTAETITGGGDRAWPPGFAGPQQANAEDNVSAKPTDDHQRRDTLTPGPQQVKVARTAQCSTASFVSESSAQECVIIPTRLAAFSARALSSLASSGSIVAIVWMICIHSGKGRCCCCALSLVCRSGFVAGFWQAAVLCMCAPQMGLFFWEGEVAAVAQGHAVPCSAGTPTAAGDHCPLFLGPAGPTRRRAAQPAQYARLRVAHRCK